LSDGAFLALAEHVSTADAKRLVELAAKQLGLVNRDLASVVS
jgi:hypothetical protein